MGVSSWWFGCFISDAEHEKIQPLYKEAKKKAVLTKEQEEAIEFWKNHPAEIDWMDFETGSRMNDFLCAFNLPGLEDLAESFCSTDGIFGDFLNEETVFRFLMTNRNTPGALLWHALGYEKAIQLPGKMGNLLVHRTEVKSTLEKVELIYKDLNIDELSTRAKLFSGQEVSDKEINEIITMLPVGLKNALELNKGMIFLSMWQL